MITDKQLELHLQEFVTGLLKKAKCKHAGNCHAMCRIIAPYVSVFYGIDTMIQHCKVLQGKKLIHHWYLLRIPDGKIIDCTASQFNFPNGKCMPKIYIGERPIFYNKIA